MDDIIRTAFAPENLVPNLVQGLITTAVAALLLRLFSENWMQRLAVLNAAVIAMLVATGHTPGHQSWLVEVPLGIAVGLVFFIAAAVGSRVVHAVVFFAMNAPAAWVAWVLTQSDLPQKTATFLVVYASWSMVVGIALAFWTTFAIDRDEAAGKVFGYLFRETVGPKSDPETK